MSEKFRNKYRIESNRMPGWDYSGKGVYFLTIVTQDREHWLGEIKNGNMILSDWGLIVENEFLKSFEIRSELFLDEYIIMPNHIHMVVRIEKLSKSGMDKLPVDTDGRPYQQSQSPLSPKNQNSKSDNPPKFYRKPKSISSFMAGFKSSVNSKIDDDIDGKKSNVPKFNRNNHFFQPNYHDRVVRNEKEYNRIVNYIRNNPKNWEEDKLNK